MAPDPANFLISSLKKNPAKNYMAPDPANFLIGSFKKNLAKKYMTPDPANNLLISSGLMKSQLKTLKQVK